MKRAEPAAVHYSSTGPHQREDDHEGRHEPLYADDLVLVANGKQELHETLLVTRH